MRAVDALPEGREKVREHKGNERAEQAKDQAKTPEREPASPELNPKPKTEPAKIEARTSEPDPSREDGSEPAAIGVKPVMKSAINPAIKPTIKREFAREFAAEMDRAAPVIGGRQTAIERKGEELSVRVIPTAISGFLAQKGLSRRDIERVRLQQFSELKLKELGITILRPTDGRLVMELEKRVKNQL